MNIIIAGCGKVGTTLGEQLVRERHEVTFIDTAPELLKKVMGMIDVQVIEGNCTVYSTLKEAGIEHADLFIAVTDSDEINLLSCLIAKKASNCHTVARVRNPEYNEDIQFIKQEMLDSAMKKCGNSYNSNENPDGKSSEDDSDDYKKGTYENDGDFFIYPSPKKVLKKLVLTFFL